MNKQLNNISPLIGPVKIVLFIPNYIKHQSIEASPFFLLFDLKSFPIISKAKKNKRGREKIAIRLVS